MKVLRVFNNNVILGRTGDGGEVILTGRGLGYQARPGQDVDQSLIAQVFTPQVGADTRQLSDILADIPTETVSITVSVLENLRDQLGAEPSMALVVGLADHLAFAVRRVRDSIVVDYPLQAEVSHLYPHEYALAQAVVRDVNAHLEVTLPAEEAVPITLHLVNAGFSTAGLEKTYQMTAVFDQVFAVIESSLGRPIDRGDVNVARFVTHLRYFFVRVEGGEQFAQANETLVTATRTGYPDAYLCAKKVQAVLELRLGQPIGEEEVAYLTIHIARLAASRET